MSKRTTPIHTHKSNPVQQAQGIGFFPQKHRTGHTRRMDDGVIPHTDVPSSNGKQGVQETLGGADRTVSQSETRTEFLLLVNSIGI